MRVQANVVQGRGAPRLIELEASSLDDARLQATQLGYTVLACQPGVATLFQRRTARRAVQLDLVVFVEQLRDLLTAGLSVIEALDALRRGAVGDAAKVLEHLERDLRTGKAFSAALAQQAVFPALLVALVQASELTSDLPQALARFLEHERRVAEVRHRLVSASIYPLLLMGVGTLVLLFLFFYVVPRFSRIFDGMNGDLPWSAQLMVAWSHLLGQHAAAVGAVTGTLLAGALLMLITPALRARMASVVLSWAPLRTRLNTYFLARWYRATGMLVAGGIPLPEALGLANSLLPLSLRSAGQWVEQGVRNGLTPSAAHAQAGMATPVAEQLMLAGERTGDLGAVLARIAQFHESEVTRTLEQTMRTLEPVVMVAIGLGVGLVVVLMYLPIFELAAAIQ